MKPELLYFDMSPVIVPADGDANISIRPLFDHCRFDNQRTYRVLHSPVGSSEHLTEKVHLEDGTMRIEERFEGEGEHSLVVEASIDDKWQQIGDFRVYSLFEDLLHRKPYKGDLHLHSSFSDGKESPGYVAAACRRIGLDFMAVTDHRQYQPSLEAQRAFQDLEIDLRIFPGEEIHPPDNPVHMLNFGGNASVNDLFSETAYRSEVKAITETLGEIPAEVDRYRFASCLWCFEKISEFGGLSIFCHPYWIVKNRFDVSDSLTELLLDRQPYDALELLGGYYPFEQESNLLQIARYQEERSKGKSVPIVGVSDAHGCECSELFGWFYTVVFSKSLDLIDLTESINNLCSAAVEALPGSDTILCALLREKSCWPTLPAIPRRSGAFWR
jgi:hypothetical protein